MEGVRSLIHPYYWVNIILSLSYVLCKAIEPVCELVFGGDCHLEMRQTEILFFLLVVVMSRARKTGSMSVVAYLTNSFMYCKVANTVLWFLAYKPYGFAYLVVFLLQALLIPQPIYKGPQNIKYFNDAKLFKEEVEGGSGVWLIEFYTPWTPACVTFAPLFAQLSAEYGLPNLQFGKVDVGRLPQLGQEFRISDSAFSKQLPTLILFKKGQISHVRPAADANGRLVKFHFNKETIVTSFDLNNLHQECKAEGATKKKKSEKRTLADKTK